MLLQVVRSFFPQANFRCLDVAFPIELFRSSALQTKGPHSHMATKSMFVITKRGSTRILWETLIQIMVSDHGFRQDTKEYLNQRGT